MYKITIEYEVDGTLIQEVLENVNGVSKQDASDSAYLRVRRDNPNAKQIDVLLVEERLAV